MKQLKKPLALILFGPTAVGKTDFALEVARRIPAEIINGDSGQFYTPLTIGTAKPDWRNESVPHHLFDIIDEPKHYTVFDYRDRLLASVSDISGRGKLPIIVGGSGFYLKSIFFPPRVGTAAVVLPTQIDLERYDSAQWWDLLASIDQERAAQIHKDDSYRLKRALSLWQQTGKKPSTLMPLYKPPINFLLLYLSRERKNLYDRINLRTERMVKGGWISEVERLRATAWEPFLRKKKLIGYDVLFDYLSGEQTEDALRKAINFIAQRTRNYAKRQKTFWKSYRHQVCEAAKSFDDRTQLLSETESINLTLLDRDLYIKQLSEKLRVYFK